MPAVPCCAAAPAHLLERQAQGDLCCPVRAHNCAGRSQLEALVCQALPPALHESRLFQQPHHAHVAVRLWPVAVPRRERRQVCIHPGSRGHALLQLILERLRRVAHRAWSSGGTAAGTSESRAACRSRPPRVGCRNEAGFLGRGVENGERSIGWVGGTRGGVARVQSWPCTTPPALVPNCPLPPPALTMSTSICSTCCSSRAASTASVTSPARTPATTPSVAVSRRRRLAAGRRPDGHLGNQAAQAWGHSRKGTSASGWRCMPGAGGESPQNDGHHPHLAHLGARRHAAPPPPAAP